MDLSDAPRRKVLYTVVVGGYDPVRRPPKIKGWDFVLFTDRPVKLWRRIGRSWDVRPLTGDGLDLARISRLPKVLPHKYLADYDYSLYADASIVFRQDPTHLAEDRGWPTFLAADHPYRQDTFEEVAECIRANKADPEALQRQSDAYGEAGLPHTVPLTANGLMFRRHMDPALIAMNEDWWGELMEHTCRDQISLPYVRWRHDFLIEAISREVYREHFTVKSHDRSFWKRMRRSFNKRIARLRGN